MSPELLDATMQMLKFGLSPDEVAYALRSYGVDDTAALIAEAIDELAVMDQAESVLTAVRMRP